MGHAPKLGGVPSGGPASQNGSPQTKNLITREAIAKFKQGHYREAKALFEKASNTIHGEAFKANIELCNRRIQELNAQYAVHQKAFYSRGVIGDVANFLNSSAFSRELNRVKELREFKAFVDGLNRLREGWGPIPPRQPNPGHFPISGSVLYCLHQTVPHATNGYSTRSHGIATGLLNAGLAVQCVSRPGFPYDLGVAGLSKGCHEQSLDGVSYYSEAGWALDKTPLDHYLAQAADLYFRRAQLLGSELIVAASNHITGLPALMAARRLGVPFVYEVRGLWEVTQASVKPEWYGSDRYRLMRTLEQQVCLEADHIIAITEELAEELQRWGIPRQRISIVPNAVNSADFDLSVPDADIQHALNLRPGTPVIGYAGSAVAYEGLELLVEALALLKERGQNFVFVFVGDGKTLGGVTQRAADLGVAEQCRFVGRVSFDQVHRYISCMEIMPVPRISCLVTELVSALKPLEAMAMGKAVVLSDVSPHKVMAGASSERALLFQKDSAASLSASLQHLIDNPNERQRLGQAARSWIEQERTWNQVTTLYAEALERVIEKHKSECHTAAMAPAKDLSQITLGLIADQFTTDTLASAVKVVPLSTDHWRTQLASEQIDALFVESAWNGNQGQWHRKVGYYSDAEFAPLEELLTHCQEQGIPSLFWNKEDPVHFDRFRKAASLCDHVFSTDSRRIIPYLLQPGAATKTASSCPFYASPKIHNLLPSTRAWQNTVAYGGTYYGKRYPERTEFMDKIMSAAAPLGLTIYDRQHSDPQSPYHYPSGLSSYVAGDLPYEEMIQAYKAHPVQINVNSVLDSPTMFSRRVIEASACGAVLISGPALGMNRYLNGAAQVVQTESEAAQALENLLQQPAYRWRMALRGARAVMRSHTTQHRLTQILRTMGLAIRAPEPPRLNLWVEELSEQDAIRILNQTLLPRLIVTRHCPEQLKDKLQSKGIKFVDDLTQVCDSGSLWVLAQPRALEQLENEDLEDLAWVSTYAPQQCITVSREVEAKTDQWPGLALEPKEVGGDLLLVRASERITIEELFTWAASQPALALRKPPASHQQAHSRPPVKTVVIAGHDLKFIKSFYPYFAKAAFRILLDFWTGHSQHDEAASKRLIEQADIVFCEWMLGNAIWYGMHKRKSQKLVARFHSQELRSPLFKKLPFQVFDKVIFVGPHILRQAIELQPTLKLNGCVVFNGVDVEKIQSVPRRLTNGKVLGMVGIVPKMKRFDLALDILSELRKECPEYILRIKGKGPEDYPWMKNRTEEMEWYMQQYRRLGEDPLLRGAVLFDAHGDDMAEWYAGIDYVLSTSDFESFHYTIADGATAGCEPIVLPWEGAEEIYKQEWIYPDLGSAVNAIKYSTRSGIKSAASYAEELFGIANIFDQLQKVL